MAKKTRTKQVYELSGKHIGRTIEFTNHKGDTIRAELRQLYHMGGESTLWVRNEKINDIEEHEVFPLSDVTIW